jgi:hypothetical protein
MHVDFDLRPVSTVRTLHSLLLSLNLPYLL